MKAKKKDDVKSAVTGAQGAAASPHAVLAAALADPELAGVAVFVSTKAGAIKPAISGMLDRDLACVAVIAHDICLESLKKNRGRA